MAKKIFSSIQQWMAAKGIVNPDKELKQLLFGLWRDRQIEIDYWKRKFQNLEQGFKKARSDIRILEKRMGIKK